MFFLLLVTAVSFAINRYLWRRLVRDPQLPEAKARIASAALIVLAAAAPVTVVAWGVASRLRISVLTAVSFSWFGLSFYLVLLLAAWDVVRAGAWVARKLGGRRSPPSALPPPPTAAVEPAASPPLAAAEASRRVFVARAAATGALLASGGIGAFGVRSALWDITMPEVPVKLARFPRALDGYTIALLTDVHIGPLLDGRFLRQLAEQINRARPDMIAIAGDLVDGHVRQIGSQIAELRRLQSRDGTYFVTGNHEYYWHAAAWLEFLPRLGLRVLMNEHLTIVPGRAGKPGDSARAAVHDRSPDGGACFDLGGVPDRHAGWAGGVAPDAALAVRGRDDQRELVMLAHQPVQIADSTAAGAGLQLSGHTHGGQLIPFGAIVRTSQPYLAGLHRHAPHTQIYVSRGTGFWGPPMRVMAPAEVALLRLSAG